MKKKTKTIIHTITLFIIAIFLTFGYFHLEKFPYSESNYINFTPTFNLLIFVIIISFGSWLIFCLIFWIIEIKIPKKEKSK